MITTVTTSVTGTDKHLPVRLFCSIFVINLDDTLRLGLAKHACMVGHWPLHFVHRLKLRATTIERVSLRGKFKK